MCQRDRSTTSTTWNNKVIVLIFFYKSRFFPSFFLLLSLLLLLSSILPLQIIPFQINNAIYISVCVYIFFFLWNLSLISNVRCIMLAISCFYALAIVQWYNWHSSMRGFLRSINSKMFILSKSSRKKKKDKHSNLSKYFLFQHTHTFSAYVLILPYNKNKNKQLLFICAINQLKISSFCS